MASVSGSTFLQDFLKIFEGEIATVTGSLSPQIILTDIIKALEEAASVSGVGGTKGPGSNAGSSQTVTGHDTINLGGGMMTVNVAAGGSALISAVDRNGDPTTATLDFINGSVHGSTVFGGSGSDTIAGGRSSNSLFEGGTSGNNVIISGTGNTTIFAGGNNDLISVVGAGHDKITAAAGNETLTALTATGNDTFYASIGHTSVIASTVHGAVDTFAFVKGQTSSTTTESIFNITSSDVVSLSGYGAAAPKVIATKGVSLLTLSDGSKITFYGATPTKIINS